MNEYGIWLRQLRGTRTRKQIAATLGITEEALKAYEEGKRLPRDEVKKRIRLRLDRKPELRC